MQALSIVNSSALGSFELERKTQEPTQQLVATVSSLNTLMQIWPTINVSSIPAEVSESAALPGTIKSGGPGLNGTSSCRSVRVKCPSPPQIDWSTADWRMQQRIQSTWFPLADYQLAEDSCKKCHQAYANKKSSTRAQVGSKGSDTTISAEITIKPVPTVLIKSFLVQSGTANRKQPICTPGSLHPRLWRDRAPKNETQTATVGASYKTHIQGANKRLKLNSASAYSNIATPSRLRISA
jgi:hypothetical protein